MNRDLGFTLTELLVASSIGVVILLAIAHVDVTRIYIGQQAQTLTTLQADPQLAVSHMAKHLIQADRVVLLDSDCAAPANPGSCIQIRIPPNAAGADLDNPALYRWVQYKHADAGDPPIGADTLEFYDDTLGTGCGTAADYRFAGLQTVQIAVVLDDDDVTPTNTLTISVTSFADPESQQAFTFTDQVTVRGAHATGLGTGLGAGNPPAAC